MYNLYRLESSTLLYQTSQYCQLDRPETVKLGDGNTVEAVGVGNAHLNMLFDDSKPKKATMYHVLYVPKLTCNLFSIRAAALRPCNHSVFPLSESCGWLLQNPISI